MAIKPENRDKRDLLVREYSDRELLIRLIKYMRPHYRIFITALAILLIGTFLELLQPIFIKIAIDDYIFKGDIEGLAVIAFFYFLIAIVSFLLSIIATYFTTITGLDIVTEIRQDTFYHLEELSMDFYHKESVGRIISRITNDVERLLNLLSTGIVDAIVNTLFLVIFFLFLFFLDVTLATTVLIIFPVIFFFIFYFRLKA
ncbi:MAG: ABC transporter transmembrane domain-containing protein, partial [Candidatus Thorarchaeota archaeon]